MTNNSSFKPSLAILVLLSAMPAIAQGQPAQGQFSQGQPPQGQQFQGQQQQGQQQQGQQQQGQPSPDQDFAALHNALHISAQQEAAWAAYRTAAPSPAVTEQRRNSAAQLFPTLTSPRRIDLVEAEMRQELVELQRQSAALKALYSVLSQEQQRVFDERTLPPEQRH